MKGLLNFLPNNMVEAFTSEGDGLPLFQKNPIKITHTKIHFIVELNGSA